MKEDGELGNLFLALSSPENSCPNPVGHERKKKGPQKQGQS